MIAYPVIIAARITERHTPFAGAPSSLGFTGYIYDDISGTYFAQVREYMPEAGRFAGRDILKGETEIPRTLNEYTYCHNNPIGYVDYNGMKATPNRSHSDLPEFTSEYTLNQDIALGIDSTVKGVPIAVKDSQYVREISNIQIRGRAEYNDLAEELIKERQITGNPRAGTGRLSNITKTTNRDVFLTKAEKDIATGRISSLGADTAASKMASVGTSAIIGGVVDASIGGVKDYTTGASRSKMLSNMGVNFAFGTAEGAFIAGATAIVGPVGLVGALFAVGLYEYFSKDREELKQTINSLE